MIPFKVTVPKSNKQPILVSAPHTGTQIPPEHRPYFKEKFHEFQPDCDEKVDELYDFCSSLGITVLSANISRYVIDLNRPLTDEKLYSDARLQTGLFPETTFEGESILTKPRTPGYCVKTIQDIYRPYHDKIASELAELKKKFPKVLLFEAHSIARVVSTHPHSPFPDLMLGDSDEKSCDPKISVTIQKILGKDFSISHNHPFKGGFITRSFHDQKKGIHSVQLEMSKDIYLEKHTPIKNRLEEMMKALIHDLSI